MRILTISGSLRAGSSNTTLLEAVAKLAPDSVEVLPFHGIGDLPHFNPDLDTDPGPSAVVDFRARLKDADAVLLSSPEYAHGVPGTLKNALDWVVGSGEFVDKAVGLINASPRATLAQASLTETLRVMTATLVDGASIAVPLLGRKLGADGIAADPEIGPALRSVLEVLIHHFDDRAIAREAGHGFE